MRIEIDTKAKLIRLCEPVAISKLQKFMKEKFPEDYQKYKISGYINNTYWPVYYPYDNTITCANGSITYTNLTDTDITTTTQQDGS